MTTYDAELRTPYSSAQAALALMRGRIRAVIMEGSNLQVGTARDFRLSRAGALVCTIDCDDAAWEAFKKESLEGATLFVGDYPVAGPFSAAPVEATHGQDV